MLSICIPVHNFDVRPLVGELDRQAQCLGEATEVLVYDNGSESAIRDLHRDLANHPRVRYERLDGKIGKSALRNRMAKEARGSHLIMIDQETWPNDRYLARYLEAVPAKVVMGGITYDCLRPDDPRMVLHWSYGQRREKLPPARRRENHGYFGSTNFLVSRETLLAHPFPELAEYGHENTLWGQLLVPTGIAVAYIENPVVFKALEPFEVFLANQRNAVKNLKELRKQYPTMRTRLTTFADRYPKMVSLTEYLPEKALLRYLYKSGDLKVLDLLKIKWWHGSWSPAITY